jgi:hypothetical protein
LLLSAAAIALASWRERAGAVEWVFVGDGVTRATNVGSAGLSVDVGPLGVGVDVGAPRTPDGAAAQEHEALSARATTKTARASGRKLFAGIVGRL